MGIIGKIFGLSEPEPTARPLHHATMPTALVVAIFKPTQSFAGYDPNGELLGHYIKGKTYYIREGNTMLAELCKQWQSEGKIILPGGQNANT